MPSRFAVVSGHSNYQIGLNWTKWDIPVPITKSGPCHKVSVKELVRKVRFSPIWFQLILLSLSVRVKYVCPRDGHGLGPFVGWVGFGRIFWHL